MIRIVLVTLPTFVLTTALVYALLTASSRRRDRLRRRLARFAAPGTRDVTTPTPAVTDTGRSRSVLGKRLARRLQLAGWPLRPEEFLALWLAGAALPALLGLVLTHRPLNAAALGLLGALLPPLALARSEGTRRQRFDTQLPDALTLLASALRAGHALSRALQVVADEMPAPISEEFQTALNQMRLGQSLEAAAVQMVSRVGSADLDLVVTAIAIQRQVGGNLAEVLDTIAHTIRERVKMQGEVRALTAEGKLSGWILFLMPPLLAFLLLLRDPHYFQPLLEDHAGIMLLIGVFAAQAVGGLVIRRMVALDL